MPALNFISVKMTEINPLRFEFHFSSIHVNARKGLTEHWTEIFNRSEISYRVHFASHVNVLLVIDC